MKTTILTLALALSTSAFAQETKVECLRHAGPYTIMRPAMIDSTDVNSSQFSNTNILNTQVDLAAVERGTKLAADGALPVSDKGASVGLLGFSISNNIYTSATISVSGLSNYRIFVDGTQLAGTVAKLQPNVHKVVIKYVAEANAKDTVVVKVDAPKATIGEIASDTKRNLSIYDAIEDAHYSDLSLSPNGRYLAYSTREILPGGTTRSKNYMVDLSSGNKSEEASPIRWMPRSNRYYSIRKNNNASTYTLVAVDPASRKETILSTCVPQASFTISPDEQFLIYSVEAEGPKERKDVFEVIEPNDRQPGWRKRYNLCKMDLKSGVVQPLTYGYHNVYLYDISNDSRYAIIGKSESRLEARPTTVMTLYRMNLETLALDTLVSRDGFIASAQFSPDGRQILLKGSPEALNGIGMDIAEGQTASNFDYQLFIGTPASNTNYTINWRPMTKAFNPSVSSVVWAKNDGMIYFTAEDKDYVNLFRLNPNNGKINKLNAQEDLVNRYAISASSSVMAYYGQSASNSDRLYTMPLGNGKSKCIDEVNKQRLAEVALGKCEAWTCLNENGDTISCRYYLPANFDASKKYPMIVNYYGGCSPTSRTFDSRYPQHAYSALGYVVLVINPRGATGFGQKWSAAHVNTAGQGPAEDIIEATKEFCKQHTFVNDKKIGCIGASYGGFMTQYLQTKTDIFAAAVSHAGISDHTSYWGEGYWGYSYSETSMANSYPWTRKDLYVDQSPLFNADKIHTPLLFVHGTGDTNVPVGESIQMYTALKLLGRPTAMVLVEGENHWIQEYQKRLQWQNTIWAWFAKWLQDDPSWWEEMYKHKDL